MTKGDAYNKGIRKNQLTGSYGDFSPVEVKSSWSRYPVDLIYFIVKNVRFKNNF